ncbi:MAG: tryptophan--tRNA ligase [Oligoflexia bacterium]|nr:tryptophan--tRNA ligase [Oligoflexia bacterium]
MSPAKRSLTGIRSSGIVHIGNYLGMIRPALERQQSFECLYFIADLHALTTNRDAQAMRSQTYDIVATFLAFGFDTKKHLMYRQSDLPFVTELAWYLSCVTGVGLLEKSHAYKDALAQDKETNHGVFAYPVLMAADILLYDADVVPVGKDQKQHVEMARDMAGSFNAAFGAPLLK